MKLNEQLTRMKSMMNLKEEKKGKYPYSCAMLYFNDDITSELHKQIDENDLYISDEMGGYGLESEPHCTLLYGLHDDEVTPEQIEDVVGKHTYTTCKAHNLSLFQNPAYDVLKYDIDGENLNKINEELKQFPFTSDYPDYHPHMTVAYLKPGKGKEYVEKMGENTKEVFMVPKHIIYSRTDGSKHMIPIRIFFLIKNHI